MSLQSIIDFLKGRAVIGKVLLLRGSPEILSSMPPGMMSVVLKGGNNITLVTSPANPFLNLLLECYSAKGYSGSGEKQIIFH